MARTIAVAKRTSSDSSTPFAGSNCTASLVLVTVLMANSIVVCAIEGSPFVLRRDARKSPMKEDKQARTR